MLSDVNDMLMSYSKLSQVKSQMRVALVGSVFWECLLTVISAEYGLELMIMLPIQYLPIQYCWLVSPPLWARLKFSKTYWMDYHEILWKHSWSPKDNSYIPVFPLAPPAGQTFQRPCEISLYLLNWLAQHLLVWTTECNNTKASKTTNVNVIVLLQEIRR